MTTKHTFGAVASGLPVVVAALTVFAGAASGQKVPPGETLPGKSDPLEALKRM